MTADDTRARLIEAASRSFADHGYDGTRIAEIARQAGLSSGAIYAHYASKAELLLASLQARSQGEIAGLVRSDRPDDLLSTIVSMGSSLDRPDHHESGLLIEAIVASRRDSELRALLAEGMAGREAMLADLLRVSQDGGQIADSVAPEVAARFLLMVRLGAKLLGLLELDPLGSEDWTTFVEQLVGAVRQQPAPA
jgi:AcrR family transcriptional regulator